MCFKLMSCFSTKEDEESASKIRKAERWIFGVDQETKEAFLVEVP